MGDSVKEKENIILADISDTPNHNLELSKYVNDENIDFKEVLKICQKNKIEVTVYGKAVDPQWMAKINELVLEKRKLEIKKGQRLGIERALQRKQEGEGHYGRPPASLPVDFEAQVIVRLQRNESLRPYKEKIDMKSSTFYNAARKVKEKWKMIDSDEKE